MKAIEILNELIDKAYYKKEDTCDKILAGDPEREVNKVAVCFKLSGEVLDKAIKENYDMIITHEPLFAMGDECTEKLIYDRKKKEIIEKSGITICRFHDHAHNYEFDYIHKGFLRALNLEVEQKFEREYFGTCRYQLKEKISAKELVKRIEKTLGIEFVRLVGNEDVEVKILGLGLGWVGFDHINTLIEKDCDLYITGEVGEIFTCQYIKDACYYGEKKALLVLGHFSSEYAGMKLLTEDINKNLVKADYIDSGEVYKRIY